MPFVPQAKPVVQNVHWLFGGKMGIGQKTFIAADGGMSANIAFGHGMPCPY